MEKIVTHPLYIRCKKVIDSCETPEQLETAFNYCKLAEKRSAVGIVKEHIEHLFAWKGLMWEVKWN